MCTRDADLQIPEKDIVFCFGMSKMAVTHEPTHYKQYQQMVFPEFLELIGRLAEIKFKNTGEMAQNPLTWKIEMLLEDLCPFFGLTKNDVKIELEDNSASDDDY